MQYLLRKRTRFWRASCLVLVASAPVIITYSALAPILLSVGTSAVPALLATTLVDTLVTIFC